MSEGIEVSFTDYEKRQAFYRENIRKTMGGPSQRDVEQARMIARNEVRLLLAARSPHLPGYGWIADWFQWMRNNHPLLGICCKYRENPVGVGERIVILLGSVSFGITATNGVFLYFKFFSEQNYTLVKMQWEDQFYDLTYEMIVLWTLGSFLHSIVDLIVWYIAACSCCMPGGCCGAFEQFRVLGKCITVYICAIFAALAITLSLMRANYEEAPQEQFTNTTIDELTELEIETIRSFSFLVGYFTELVLVYFVYFPIVGTVLFSGILRPCLPCIGGRPQEIDRQRVKRQQNNDQRPFIRATRASIN